MQSLLNKVILITGASSGIGAGAALGFAGCGSRLALTGRNVENLNKTADKCKELGLNDDKILLLNGDLTDDKFAQSLVGRAVERYGQLDVLVNNAGIVVYGTTATMPLDNFDRQMNINCRVYYHLSHLSIPHLKKTKGSIVNVSSVYGLRSFSGPIAYCMSKAAVDQLTRCCALELAKDGVRVNAVNPGVIKTELQLRGGRSEENYKEHLEYSKTTHAMGRVGETSEVTSTILFLASDAASFITGATIPIDGGRHAMCPR